jgi:hypothetical protein
MTDSVFRVHLDGVGDTGGRHDANLTKSGDARKLAGATTSPNPDAAQAHAMLADVHEASQRLGIAKSDLDALDALVAAGNYKTAIAAIAKLAAYYVDLRIAEGNSPAESGDNPAAPYAKPTKPTIPTARRMSEAEAKAKANLDASRAWLGVAASPRHPRPRRRRLRNQRASASKTLRSR